MKKQIFLFLSAALTFECHAQLSPVKETGLINETRELRKENRFSGRERVSNTAARAAAVGPAAEQAITTDLSVGAAFTDGDGQHAWNTPISALFSFPNTPWQLSVTTGGYEHDSFPDGNASGWTDVKFKGLYTFMLDSSKLVAGAALRAPAHGEVGSRHWQQEVSLAYKFSAGSMFYTVSGALKRNSGQQAPGVSAYPRYGSFLVGRDLGGDTSVSFVIDRLMIPGQAGISTAGVAYDFVLGSFGGRKYGAEVSLTKGISKTDRSTALEFDVSTSF